VSAFAQSSVTLSGLVDAGYQSLNIRGAKVTNSAGSNGSATTALIFAGTEDIGGGLKASFQYEIDPSVVETSSKTAGTSATGTTSNVTSSAGNGQSFIQLAGNFGSIKFGTPNTSTLSANGDGNQGFGTAIGSGYRVSSFDAVRFQNTLRFDTPTFSGFSAAYLTGAKNDKQANAGTAGFTGNVQNQAQGRDEVSEISAAYANGPLSVRYADLLIKQYAGVDVTTGTIAAAGTLVQPTWTAGTGAEFKLKTLSAKYDVNKDLSVSYFNQKTDSEVLKATKTSANTGATAQFARKASGIAASYTVGAYKFMVNRAQVKVGDETGTGTVDNTKTTVTGLGLDYALSKRTTAYVRYEKDDDQAKVRAVTGYTASPSTNTDYTATAIGIRHTF
jgi:predicted porin